MWTKIGSSYWWAWVAMGTIGSTHCNWSCSTDTSLCLLWCYLVPMCAYSDVYTCVQTMPKVMLQILHYMLSVDATIKHIIHILIHVGMCTSRNPWHSQCLLQCSFAMFKTWQISVVFLYQSLQKLPAWPVHNVAFFGMFVPFVHCVLCDCSRLPPIEPQTLAFIQKERCS